VACLVQARAAASGAAQERESSPDGDPCDRQVRYRLSSSHLSEVALLEPGQAECLRESKLNRIRLSQDAAFPPGVWRWKTRRLGCQSRLVIREAVHGLWMVLRVRKNPEITSKVRGP
jgi:hypothetical protein